MPFYVSNHVQAQDLWEVLGARKLPPIMFLFYSDKAWAPLSGQRVDCRTSGVVLDGHPNLGIRLVCDLFGREKAKIAAGPCGHIVRSQFASFLASKQTKLTTPLPAMGSWQKLVRLVVFGTRGCFLPWAL